MRNKKIACGRQIADILRKPTTTGDRNQAAMLMTIPRPGQEHTKSDQQPGWSTSCRRSRHRQRNNGRRRPSRRRRKLVNMPVRVTTSTNIPYRSTPSPWIMNGVRTRLPATPDELANRPPTEASGDAAQARRFLLRSAKAAAQERRPPWLPEELPCPGSRWSPAGLSRSPPDAPSAH